MGLQSAKGGLVTIFSSQLEEETQANPRSDKKKVYLSGPFCVFFFFWDFHLTDYMMRLSFFYYKMKVFVPFCCQSVNLNHCMYLSLNDVDQQN